jgi:uncharacterized membrane protein YcaP (DUF421 family)
MESVLRGILVYSFLLVVFRLSGKRTLSQSSNFDFVLLLIISETTQQAMVNSDHSITNALILILTLVGMTIGLSIVKQRFPAVEKLLEGRPLLLIDRGEVKEERLDRSRVDRDDLLEAARMNHGLERLDQVKYAVLERHGEISIVPKEPR